jgi:xanthine dehydrogenase accessory factor
VLWEGAAEADTGVPGNIDGYGIERVLRSPMAGELRALREIGDTVRVGDPVFAIEGDEGCVVSSKIDGVVRGIVRNGFPVWEGFKAADVDPRARGRIASPSPTRRGRSAGACSRRFSL